MVPTEASARRRLTGRDWFGASESTSGGVDWGCGDVAADQSAGPSKLQASATAAVHEKSPPPSPAPFRGSKYSQNSAREISAAVSSRIRCAVSTAPHSAKP